MIEYFGQLMQQEQEEVRNTILLLYRQTFILERKYDRKSGRLLFNKDYRNCEKHLDFIRDYFDIMGIEVRESSQEGIFYLQNENLVGEKMSRLSTLYVLILKLVYDEQMNTASSSSLVYATVGEMNEKLAGFGLLARQPAFSEIRKAVAFLKKYQIVEPLALLEEIDNKSRLLIYPSIHMVLLGDHIRELLSLYGEGVKTGGLEAEKTGGISGSPDYGSLGENGLTEDMLSDYDEPESAVPDGELPDEEYLEKEEDGEDIRGMEEEDGEYDSQI